jgi:hypothetical protein
MIAQSMAIVVCIFESSASLEHGACALNSFASLQHPSSGASITLYTTVRGHSRRMSASRFQG